MANKLDKEFEYLVKIIKDQVNGISVGELFHLLKGDIPRRTLQYRLSALHKSKILKIQGSGRNSKYYISQEPDDYQPQKENEAALGAFKVPLSSAGAELCKKISLPIQLRGHVSYQRKFLEAYEPNKTSYLSKPILEKLFKLGCVGDQERPAGTYARTIYQRFLIDLSWNSSRLEGNTYSLLETERLLETGEMISGKNQLDAQMILNHKAAIEFIVEMAREVDINRYTILNIHALLSHNLIRDPKNCGSLRKIPVKIGQSVYHPVEVPQLIEEYFQLIVQKSNAIKNPFEQSFFLMVHLPYLQPFLDVNKRVSRLAGNIPFIRENLSPLSFVDVPEKDYVLGLLAVYELNQIELFRDIFVWAYERSASLYLTTVDTVKKPDTFQFFYYNLIRQAIRQVVQNKMDRLKASQFISKFAHENVVLEDQNRFINTVEVEVSSLHAGNYARFKINDAEFYEWHQLWK